MSNNEEDRESTKRATPRWRKVAVWLAGAAVLAFVGYRGGLGNAVAGPSGSTTAAPVVETHNAATPDAPSTAEAPTEAPARTAAPRASPPPTASDDAPAASTTTAPAHNTAPASEPARAPQPAPASSAITADGKVILNVATEADLRKLPGIGKARARAILEQRERLGRFRRVEDLLRIKGIGPKRLVALRSKVVLDPP